MNFTILRFDSIDSTNTEALKHARQGAEEGLCITARQQTAGRGRHGRVWASPKDAGLYFSVVLRPKIDAKYLPLIALATGIAVHDTLTELGLKPDIKWPNDVLVNEKKISGILAETTETREGQAVVVGIGINLTSKNFPPEISAMATSIAAEIKRPIPVSEMEILLAKYFGYFYGVLIEDQGPEAILEEWQRRSSYASGKRVRIKLGDESITGVTQGLAPNGALLMQKNDGTIVDIQAGDVERLRADN
jgi:BirA family biotin operon repressor/biotin-[acetyl-CoA-carboxylase] ligase